MNFDNEFSATRRPVEGPETLLCQPPSITKHSYLDILQIVLKHLGKTLIKK